MNAEIIIGLVSIVVGLYVVIMRKKLISQQRNWSSSRKYILQKVVDEENDEVHTRNAVIAGIATVLFGIAIILVQSNQVTNLADQGLTSKVFSGIVFIAGLMLLILKGRQSKWSLIAGVLFILVSGFWFLRILSII